MNLKEDLRVKRTKKLLRDSVYQLAFIEKLRLQDITVQDICDLAMVHRATFYKYYTDKYDLCIKQFYPKEMFNTRIKRLKNPFQSFEKTYLHSEIHRLMLLNLGDTYLQEILILQERDLILLDAEILLNEANFDLPKDMFILMFSSLIGALMEKWLKTGFKIPAEELDRYLKTMLHPKLLGLLEDID